MNTGDHFETKIMHDYKKIVDLSNDLIASIDARNALLMQQKMDTLNLAYQEEFGDLLDCYEAVYSFVKMYLAGAKYFAHNNMFMSVHELYNDVAGRMDGFLKSYKYSEEQKTEVKSLFIELEKLHKATPKQHQNLVVGRIDTRCCMCRLMPVNKTGSHMVPNFLAHPTFSWDGKGKRFHEALNHHFLNAPQNNCQFYGREVPDWRFAMGEGKEEVTDEDIEKNINQLEYDNVFCSHCEDRFAVLESAYSRFYNGQQKAIHPRVSYLFWLSVLWRMSVGGMSIFMDIRDELALRQLLNENMLDTVTKIEDSDADIGNWQYAIFKAEGLRDGDKAILGCRRECSPYVVTYNNLVMVFFHNEPTEAELTIGPITVQREMLNDWHSPEKCAVVDRRWYWDVRDWYVESSYDYYDPIREETLVAIREKERSEGRIVGDRIKSEEVKYARLMSEPQSKLLRLRKMERIFDAWMRKEEAEKKGDVYNPLQDEELFLQQRDFDMYYRDLAALSRNKEMHDKVPEFPFYEQARQAMPDEQEWVVSHNNESDGKYVGAMTEFLGALSPKELNHVINGVPMPHVNAVRIGRNAPCPCGSGKKFKHCHGKR